MPLVTYDEQAEFLGIESGSDMQLITDLLTQTQALFEIETGRGATPYGVAQVGRIEIHEGYPGSSILTLDYPIASIASIGIGRDVLVPDVIITPSDASTVEWQVGGRVIARVDGGYWNRWYPSWVKVVYTTMPDTPEDVKLAIKQKVAEIYLHRDKLGFSSVTRGARSWTMAASGVDDNTSSWDRVVRAHRRGWVR